MSFSASCTEWKLKDGHILKAKAKDTHGKLQDCTIDLNKYIGNSDGWFVWGQQDFSHSAHDIRLEGTKLCAYLTTRDGGRRERQGIELNDKITNNNGCLHYVG